MSKPEPGAAGARPEPLSDLDQRELARIVGKHDSELHEQWAGPFPGATDLIHGDNVRTMDRKPNSEDSKPDTPGAGDTDDATKRLADRIDDETWLTLGAAIGQLSGIHDPDVLAH